MEIFDKIRSIDDLLEAYWYENIVIFEYKYFTVKKSDITRDIQQCTNQLKEIYDN